MKIIKVYVTTIRVLQFAWLFYYQINVIPLLWKIIGVFPLVLWKLAWVREGLRRNFIQSSETDVVFCQSDYLWSYVIINYWLFTLLDVYLPSNRSQRRLSLRSSNYFLTKPFGSLSSLTSFNFTFLFGWKANHDLNSSTHPCLVMGPSSGKMWKFSTIIQYLNFILVSDGLWGLVNNAGILCLAPIEWSPLEDFKRTADVNIWGIIDVTKTFLPLLKTSKGRVVNLGSMAG